MNATIKLPIIRENHNESVEITDLLAVEEPLEISMILSEDGKRVKKNISVTMRTPGNDRELAAGFLFTEGIIKSKDQIKGFTQNSDNEIQIEMNEGLKIDLKRIERHFYTSSSCGVCGKSSIDSLKSLDTAFVMNDSLKISRSVIYGLDQVVRNAQSVFESTGGLHASALFDSNGQLISLFEDVGRHNALDKMIGNAFLNSEIPLQEKVLFLSGRACYELIQKAAMAGIPVICALGAPSSLAVELAREFRITLIGFLKSSGFNIYSGASRIA
jgi:FdhD protein